MPQVVISVMNFAQRQISNVVAIIIPWEVGIILLQVFPLSGCVMPKEGYRNNTD